MSKPSLRDYQSQFIDMIGAAIRVGCRRVVGQMATGGGKTLTIAEVISRAEAKGNRTLFVCDSLELVEQAVKAFDSYGLQVGVMQGQHYRTDESCLTQVCTAQTLDRRIEKFRPQFEQYPVHLIVIDECHIQFRVRETLATLYPNAVIIGLTATPFSKGMGKFYTGIISAIAMSTLIDEGYLCPYTAYAPYVPNMKGIRKSGGDYTGDAAAKVYNRQLIADIVDTWMKFGKGRPTLAFGCNVAHSKYIAEQFLGAGINAVHIDGYGDDDDKAARHQAIEDYKNGKIQILCSVGICTKGFDAPLTSCLIIARPTDSLSLHWQIVGRALRTHPSKTNSVILDHAGNFVRHGFPTDDIEFVLDDGNIPDVKPDSRKKDEKLPTPCPKCQALKTAHKCPQCGFAPEKQNTVVNVEGELVLLADVEAKEAAKGPKQYTDEQKADWHRMLKAYEIDKGKKPGYSAYLYRDKFGEDPKYRYPQDSKPPTDEVSGWIKHNNIRKAKGRAKHAA